MLLLRFSTLLVVICFWAAQVGIIDGLYEDEIGVKDWTRRNLGSTQLATFVGQYAIVATRQGAIAALDATNNGEIKWRSVVPMEESNSSVLEPTDLGFSFLGLSKATVVAVGKDLCKVQGWHSVDGSLLWDLDLCRKLRTEAFDLQKSLHSVVLSRNKENIVMVIGNVAVVIRANTGEVVHAYDEPNGIRVEGVLCGEDRCAVFGRVGSTGDLYVRELADGKESIILKAKLSSSEPILVSGSNLVWVSQEAQTVEFYSIDSYPEVAFQKTSHKVKKLSPLSQDAEFPYFLAEDGRIFHLHDNQVKMHVLDELTGKSFVATGSFITGAEKKTGFMAALLQDDTAAKPGSIDGVVLASIGSQNPIVLEFPEDIGASGGRGAVRDIFIQAAWSKKTKSVSARLLVHFEDDSIVLIQIRRENEQASPSLSTLYVREEALAEILEVVPIDLPMDESEINAELAEKISITFAKGSALEVILLRLKDQLRVTWATARALFVNLQRYASIVVESRGMVVLQWYRGELPGTADVYSTSSLDTFGFRRGLLSLTQAGKLYLLDALSGNILYCIFDRGLAGGRTRMVLTRAHGAGSIHPPEIALISLNFGSVQYRNALNGAILAEEKSSTGGNVVGLVTVSQEKVFEFESQDKETIVEEVYPSAIVVTIDSNSRWQAFPGSKSDWLHSHPELLSTLHSVNYNATSKSLSGQVLGNNYQALNMWSLVVPKTDEVLLFERSKRSRINNPGISQADGSVLVKYLNDNVIILMTKKSTGELLVTLLDAVSGRILHRISHENGAGPAHAVLFANTVVYSFWNTLSRRTEVSIVGLYEGTIGARELNLWSPRSEVEIGGKKHHSSFNTEAPVVMQRTFVVDRFIRALGVTLTRFGIADQRVLLGLDSGSINLQMRQYLSPRRPLSPSKVPNLERLQDYFPQLPVFAETTVSYNLTLGRIASIHSFPTKLESNTLVFVTGLDLFFSRVMPSNGFDLLNEDFSHTLLILLSTGLVVSTVFLSGRVKRKKISTLWK